jgi:hypothetical protein
MDEKPPMPPPMTKNGRMPSATPCSSDETKNVYQRGIFANSLQVQPESFLPCPKHPLLLYSIQLICVECVSPFMRYYLAAPTPALRGLLNAILLLCRYARSINRHSR